MAKPIEINADTFAQEVLQSPTPVLVDFWAQWCAPCHMMAPVVEEIATEYAGKLKVVKVDVDQNPQLAAKFEIMSIPTLILFKNGAPADKIIGYMPKEKVVERIKPHL